MTLWNGLELPESYFHDDNVYIIHGDCLEIMPQILSRSIDLVLCDLPYGITARNKWDEVIPVVSLWKEYHRLCSDKSPVVLTAYQPFTSLLITSNLQEYRYLWVWKKTRPVGFLNANRCPMRIHEDIIVFARESPRFYPQGLVETKKRNKRTKTGTNYGLARSNDYDAKYTNYPNTVIEFASESNTQHPTQKPENLFSYLIKTYTNDNDIILDNCLGSGTTAVCARKENRKCIGIEISEEYCELSAIRYLRSINE